MGDSFLSKSFLFEIVDSETEIISQSFTLVLPPQSYSIREKQRVSITKTFGNAFIDDYGPDNLEITIKGISGTAHVFPTFQSMGKSLGSATAYAAPMKDVLVSTEITASGHAGKSVYKSIPNPATEGYNAKSAFYYFRDNIMRYKDGNPDFSKKELRVYDLADEQAYKCVLLEFSVDRDSSQPHRYPFTISLFVYAKFGSKNASKASPIIPGGNPSDILGDLLEAMNSLEKSFTIIKTIQQFKNAVAKVTNQLRLLSAKLKSWIATGRNILESPLLLTKQVLDSFVSLASIGADAYNQGKMLVNDYMTFSATVNESIRGVLKMYSFAIQEGSAQSKTSVIEEYNGMDYTTNERSAAPTSKEKGFSFSGMNQYIVHGGDTLQSLAQTYLGDSSLWPHIASINPQVTCNSDLTVGMQIYIPVATDSGSEVKDTYILSEDTARDPYGADIRLDSTGVMILTESNDVSTIVGLDNVLQAVDVRLKTQVGSLLKQSAFGLMLSIGMAGTAMARSYLRMNFINSLIQDPRVVSVSNVGIGFNGDTVQLTGDLLLVGRDTTIPVSTNI